MRTLLLCAVLLVSTLAAQAAAAVNTTNVVPNLKVLTNATVVGSLTVSGGITNSPTLYGATLAGGATVTGNLGIGTSVPGSSLTVSGSTAPYLSRTNALSVSGTINISRTETETNYYRPVEAALTYKVDPGSTPAQTTDYHGVDLNLLTLPANSTSLANARLYAFESTASHLGNGALNELYSGYFQVRSESTNSVDLATSLRLWTQIIPTNGHIGISRGLYVGNPNAPFGTLGNAYGIVVDSITSGVGENLGIRSPGTNYLGSLKNPALLGGAVVTNAELCLNGTPSSTSTYGWLTSAATLSAASGKFTLSEPAGTGSAFMYQNISVIPGNTYTFSFTVVSRTGDGRTGVYLGTTVFNNSYYASGYVANGTYTTTILATGTNVCIQLYSNSPTDTAQSSDWTGISLVGAGNLFIGGSVQAARYDNSAPTAVTETGGSYTVDFSGNGTINLTLTGAVTFAFANLSGTAVKTIIANVKNAQATNCAYTFPAGVNQLGILGYQTAGKIGQLTFQYVPSFATNVAYIEGQ